MIVHQHAGSELGLYANAYLVETETGVVAVDTTLTQSDSLALRARFEALGKPLLAVLLTHAHPDHVAGTVNLINGQDVPVYALASVAAEMRRSERAKHAQWSAVFGSEWIPAWVHPSHLLHPGQTATLGGVAFRVLDLGCGGDSPANSAWLAEDEMRVAFVGDLAFSGTHSYLADGGVLLWLANLRRYRTLFGSCERLYPGHGTPRGTELLDVQEAYLLAYLAAAADVSGGGALGEAAVRELTGRMRAFLPGAPLEFMIALSARAVMAELYGDVSGEPTPEQG